MGSVLRFCKGAIRRACPVRAYVVAMKPEVGRAVAILVVAVILSVATPGGAHAQATTDLLTAAKEIVKMIIDLVIGLSALLLALSIATNFAQGILENMAGRPMGLSNVWLRIAGVIICAAGAFLAISCSNMIIDGLAPYAGGDIHLP